ncbi:Bacterial regulatory proteins, tetR family [bacterium YEK0313]|nr:Bacterial regulatory proteins, tetR family [bacterium YEK0313]
MDRLSSFQAHYDLGTEALCARILKRHRETIRVKKAHVATANLARIVDATLKLANRTAFHSMTVRDLVAETGLSMGALYAYVDTKDTLLAMILDTVTGIVVEVLDAPPAEVAGNPAEHLRWFVRSHVFLSETMLPWFVFAYMEAKAFPPQERRKATMSEQRTEGMIAAILEAGKAKRSFAVGDITMTAALIKPMIQDWYVKRAKYRKRNVGPEAFAAALIGFIESAILKR